MRFPAGGALWRTQSYYDWSVRRNGGMLQSLKVGRSLGGRENLHRSYAYNSFGGLPSAVKRAAPLDHWHFDHSNIRLDPAATRET